MLTTIEAEIDVNGNIKLLEPLQVKKKSRIIVTLLDSANVSKHALSSGSAAEKIDWNNEDALRAAFAELEDEERELANAGMSDYAAALTKIDGE